MNIYIFFLLILHVVMDLFYHTVPSAPVDLVFTSSHSVESMSTFTASIVLPSGSVSEEFRPQYYEVFIRPQPLMQPSTKQVSSTFEVTLDIRTLYTFTVTSVSCGGRNSFTKTIQIRTLLSCMFYGLLLYGYSGLAKYAWHMQYLHGYIVIGKIFG